MSQIEAVIVSQYTTIVYALDQMFQEIDLRSNGSLWRWEDSPYHRENQGCVLGELKSPLCISHIDGYEPNYYRYDELQERFGIKSGQLTMDISWILRTILEAKDPYNRNNLQSPVENDTFVNNAYEAVLQMTNHVRRFPILHSNSTQAASSKE